MNLNVLNVSSMDLDRGSDMIIFDSILTTFEASFIFHVKLLELKIEPPYANLACLIGRNTL